MEANVLGVPLIPLEFLDILDYSTEREKSKGNKRNVGLQPNIPRTN